VRGERQLNELLAQTLALPLHKKGRLASLSCLVKSWDLHKETFLHPSLSNPSIHNILSLHSRGTFNFHLLSLFLVFFAFGLTSGSSAPLSFLILYI
jgi:hypothetical protein